jgi:hypothetical protein
VLERMMTRAGEPCKHPAVVNCWWVISSETLLDALHRVAAGEDPDLVYLEEYVNAERQLPGDEGEE